MDSLFDLLLTLTPIALFIALRIYASQKKKVEEDERARLAKFLAKAAKGEEAPRPTFAQLSALVDEAEIDEVEVEAPVSAKENASIGPRIQAMETASLSEVSPASVRPTSRKASTPVARPADRFVARMERMSPLKRAVVMMEVLGSPKGL